MVTESVPLMAIPTAKTLANVMANVMDLKMALEMFSESHIGLVHYAGKAKYNDEQKRKVEREVVVVVKGLCAPRVGG